MTGRTENDNYWRNNYSSKDYYKSGHTYDDDYAPAYRYGYDSASTHAGRKFDEVENDLQHGWEQAKGKSKLAWSDAKHAVKEAGIASSARFRAMPTATAGKGDPPLFP